LRAERGSWTAPKYARCPATAAISSHSTITPATPSQTSRATATIRRQPSPLRCLMTMPALAARMMAVRARAPPACMAPPLPDTGGDDCHHHRWGCPRTPASPEPNPGAALTLRVVHRSGEAGCSSISAGSSGQIRKITQPIEKGCRCQDLSSPRDAPFGNETSSNVGTETGIGPGLDYRRVFLIELVHERFTA
jgi:hypothetical protein